MAGKCSMPQFIARCLEEIGLEGRCGLPLCELFETLDPEKDLAYRTYTWSILRSMESQLSFHIMRPLDISAAETKPVVSGVEEDMVPRRKRKWKTTLLKCSSTEAAEMETSVNDFAKRALKRKKIKAQSLQPVLPSMRRIAAQKERRRQSESDCERRNRIDKTTRLRRRRQRSDVCSTEEKMIIGKIEKKDTLDDLVTKKNIKKQRIEQDQPPQQERKEAINIKLEDAEDEAQWVLRSPRGFRLGEEVDVRGLSYEEAMTSNQDGVLGVLACEQVRLKCLGVEDTTSMDTISPQFDLLEIIGRSKVRGENAASLTNSRLFGDSRKLHYLLDMLIGGKYVVKNIVTANQRRFNIVHLRRFASQFRPAMVSPSASIGWQAFPKEALAQTIVSMMRARGDRTCVFADIGRELGYGKRHQEQLRNYFIQQMNYRPTFPLQMFMARCKTAGELIGRKLWCIRRRDDSPGVSSRRHGSSLTCEELEPGCQAVGRPAIERGIMEQMYVAIQDREVVGATVPELRDVLGVPTFKLPYKLAQGLISNYNISVEQVVSGKSTVYRMFIPGAEKYEENCQHGMFDNSSKFISSTVSARATSSSHQNFKSKRTDGNCDGNNLFQPGTMMQAARGTVRTSTIDRRRKYIIERVQMEKIVSLHQLRSGLIEMEREAEASTMDIRSVRRIVDKLVEEKIMTLLDITLPPKQVFQKFHRKVKCAVLLEHQRSHESIRAFIEAYEKEQQQKYRANFANHDNDDYVVVSNRRKHQQISTSEGSGIHNLESYEQEVVNYSAMSYKLARLGLAKQQKQGRRLGMYFGMMYKCRAFHVIIWNRLDKLNARYNVDKPPDAINAASSCNNSTEVSFALKDIIDLMTVKEYVQLVGVPKLLTEREEQLVRVAILKGSSWDALSTSLAEKLRGCEADRFSKIMRVLLDLRLLQVVHDTSSTGLFDVFQTCDDFDSIVSRVAFATMSGGLFKIKRLVHISVKQGTRVLHRLPSECSYAYAPGFSCRSKSDHFTGRVPLEFEFNDANDVKAYWKSLRFLSVEGAYLRTASCDSNSVSVKLNGDLIQSAPLSEHNIYVLKAWVPHSTSTTRNSTARARAAAGPIQMLQRKHCQDDMPSNATILQKRQKTAKPSIFSTSALMTPADTSKAGVSKFRKQVSARKTCRTLTWSLKDDLRLVDLYLEQMSRRWFVEVPLALQKREERVAFRTTNLTRTLISWKELGKAFKRKPIECMLRINDLLEAPAIQARLERAKITITQMKNPGGKFHEEVAVMNQPRLTALFCRALQVVLHERSCYYSVLADALLSNWMESEAKLVWRYMWLAGIIIRTPQANEGKDQKQRGFQVHSKVFEMKSLKISHYWMETFCEAAEYVSFVNENVDEATIENEESDRYFEHEMEPNVPSGQAAVALSSMISGFCRLVPSYVKPSKKCADDCDFQQTFAVKGLAGHLSRQCDGVIPDDFLAELWNVKIIFGISDVSTQARKIKEMEAFSCSIQMRQQTQSNFKAKWTRHESYESVSSWLSATLTEAASSGMSLKELSNKYTASGLTNFAECNTAVDMLIQREVEKLVHEGIVLEVNGYDHSRFLLQEFADLWSLHPYRISHNSTADKVHFLFDKTSTVVARPWLHLDGSVNMKIALKVKRKVVNIVMCCPGICDRAIHRKMRKLFSLQDMRSLLEELTDSRILYARVIRRHCSPFASIFNLPSSPPHQNCDILAIFPGELRYVDFSRDHLLYFPSVNCIELLGAEACDADFG
ncbi:putative B-block binding subunit of TFIIIC [Plasmopara halstedii]